MPDTHDDDWTSGLQKDALEADYTGEIPLIWALDASEELCHLSRDEDPFAELQLRVEEHAAEAECLEYELLDRTNEIMRMQDMLSYAVTAGDYTVGDRVRTLGGSLGGMLGTVVKIEGGNVHVNWDGFDHHEEQGRPWNPNWMKKVEENPEDFFKSLTSSIKTDFHDLKPMSDVGKLPDDTSPEIKELVADLEAANVPGWYAEPGTGFNRDGSRQEWQFRLDTADGSHTPSDELWQFVERAGTLGLHPWGGYGSWGFGVPIELHDNSDDAPDFFKSLTSSRKLPFIHGDTVQARGEKRVGQVTFVERSGLTHVHFPDSGLTIAYAPEILTRVDEPEEAPEDFFKSLTSKTAAIDIGDLMNRAMDMIRKKKPVNEIFDELTKQSGSRQVATDIYYDALNDYNTIEAPQDEEDHDFAIGERVVETHNGAKGTIIDAYMNGEYGVEFDDAVGKEEAVHASELERLIEDAPQDDASEFFKSLTSSIAKLDSILEVAKNIKRSHLIDESPDTGSPLTYKGIMWPTRYDNGMKPHLRLADAVATRMSNERLVHPVADDMSIALWDTSGEIDAPEDFFKSLISTTKTAAPQGSIDGIREMEFLDGSHGGDSVLGHSADSWFKAIKDGEEKTFFFSHAEPKNLTIVEDGPRTTDPLHQSLADVDITVTADLKGYFRSRDDTFISATVPVKYSGEVEIEEDKGGLWYITSSAGYSQKEKIEDDVYRACLHEAVKLGWELTDVGDNIAPGGLTEALDYYGPFPELGEHSAGAPDFFKSLTSATYKYKTGDLVEPADPEPSVLGRRPPNAGPGIVTRVSHMAGGKTVVFVEWPDDPWSRGGGSHYEGDIQPYSGTGEEADTEDPSDFFKGLTSAKEPYYKKHEPGDSPPFVEGDTVIHEDDGAEGTVTYVDSNGWAEVDFDGVIDAIPWQYLQPKEETEDPEEYFKSLTSSTSEERRAKDKEYNELLSEHLRDYDRGALADAFEAVGAKDIADIIRAGWDSTSSEIYDAIPGISVGMRDEMLRWLRGDPEETSHPEEFFKGLTSTIKKQAVAPLHVGDYYMHNSTLGKGYVVDTDDVRQKMRIEFDSAPGGLWFDYDEAHNFTPVGSPARDYVGDDPSDFFKGLMSIKTAAVGDGSDIDQAMKAVSGPYFKGLTSTMDSKQQGDLIKSMQALVEEIEAEESKPEQDTALIDALKEALSVYIRRAHGDTNFPEPDMWKKKSVKKSTPLLFDDHEFGTKEFGMIPRELNPDDAHGAAAEEDYRYQEYLREKGIDGYINRMGDVEWDSLHGLSPGDKVVTSKGVAGVVITPSGRWLEPGTIIGPHNVIVEWDEEDRKSGDGVSVPAADLTKVDDPSDFFKSLTTTKTAALTPAQQQIAQPLYDNDFGNWEDYPVEDVRAVMEDNFPVSSFPDRFLYIHPHHGPEVKDWARDPEGWLQAMLYIVTWFGSSSAGVILEQESDVDDYLGRDRIANEPKIADTAVEWKKYLQQFLDGELDHWRDIPSDDAEDFFKSLT